MVLSLRVAEGQLLRSQDYMTGKSIFYFLFMTPVGSSFC